MTSVSPSSTETKPAEPLPSSQNSPNHASGGFTSSQKNQSSNGEHKLGSGASHTGESQSARKDYAFHTQEKSPPADQGEGSEETQGKSSSMAPSWITDNLKSKHSLKMLFRCWLVSWVAIIVILPTKSLQTLGQAAFFVW